MDCAGASRLPRAVFCSSGPTGFPDRIHVSGAPCWPSQRVFRVLAGMTCPASERSRLSPKTARHPGHGRSKAMVWPKENLSLLLGQALCPAAEPHSLPFCCYWPRTELHRVVMRGATLTESARGGAPGNCDSKGDRSSCMLAARPLTIPGTGMGSAGGRYE